MGRRKSLSIHRIFKINPNFRNIKNLKEMNTLIRKMGYTNLYTEKKHKSQQWFLEKLGVR